MEEFFNHLSAYLSLSKIYIKLLALAIAAATSYTIANAFFNLAKKLYKNSGSPVELINRKFKIALSLFLTVIVLNILLPAIQFSASSEYFIKKFFFICFVCAFAFLLIKMTEFGRDYVYLKREETDDNLSMRKVRTQIGFLQKLANLFIILFALSIVLMSFNRVREIGTSLIASAGIAGVIIGFAAQKSIANLLAGLQIAITQPIRIDDVVVVENETGKIEEITLTYVVVRVWDERRMVLPISYFIDKPFQNWTRKSGQIIGTVFLFTDYSISVEKVRRKFMEVIKESPHWDGAMAVLEVVDCTEKCMQLRAVVSSSDIDNSGNLKCMIREKLLEFISGQLPENLPVMRSQIVK